MNETIPLTDEQIIALPFEERAERLLCFVFGGMHHVYSLKKQPAPYPWWSMIHSGYVSTYDFDHLTRLVVAAHHYCVRVEITNGGPRALKIMLHPRHGRDGCTMSRRHPTLQQALESFHL
jgi:hypothetical protein